MDIKRVLKKYGVTQTELAEKLGIYRESLSRALSEGNDPRVSTMLKIAKAIGCPLSELLGEDENNVGTITCPHCGKSFPININVEPKQ